MRQLAQWPSNFAEFPQNLGLMGSLLGILSPFYNRRGFVVEMTRNILSGSQIFVVR